MLATSMSTIPAALVKKLRDQTGAPMMECKRALGAEGVDGDLEKAVDYLRKSGVDAANKRSGRETSQGLVTAVSSSCARYGVVLELNSETDFVARNELFQDAVSSFAQTAMELAAAAPAGESMDLLEEISKATPQGSEAGTTVADAVKELSANVRENVVLRRCMTVAAPPGGFVASYVHNDFGRGAGTMGCVVAFNCQPEGSHPTEAGEEGFNVAMHVAAAKPQFATADRIPSETLEHEREVFSTQALSEGKPEKIVPKIVDGKIRKWMEGCVLQEQPYILSEDGHSVGAVLTDFAKSNSMEEFSVADFARFELGED